MVALPPVCDGFQAWRRRRRIAHVLVIVVIVVETSRGTRSQLSVMCNSRLVVSREHDRTKDWDRTVGEATLIAMCLIQHKTWQRQAGR